MLNSVEYVPTNAVVVKVARLINVVSWPLFSQRASGSNLKGLSRQHAGVYADSEERHSLIAAVVNTSSSAGNVISAGKGITYSSSAAC